MEHDDLDLAREHTALLGDHERVSRQLVDAIREAGDMRRDLIQARGNLWRQTAGMSITERRETVTAQSDALAGEVERADADVQALRVELNIIETQLRHL